MKQMKTALILALGITLCSFAKRTPTPTWIEVEKAVAEVEHFDLIGEYVSNDGKTAVQANLLKDGQFLVATYPEGLPGKGWNKNDGLKSELLPAEELKTRLATYTKTVRTSPTLGEKAPDNAILKFPDDLTNIKDGIMHAGGQTQKELGSFKMHLEFFMPLKPERNLSSQDRGNSGIYIFNNYEIQIMDAFALDYENPENNANQIDSLNTQWCGCIYKMKRADINMTFPPLTWQSYDIEFIAPVFEGQTKVKNARLTVFHNGVKTHDDFELKSGTGNGAKKPQLAKGPVYFQNHGNPVMFRNVWAVEL